MNRMKRFNYTFILLPFLACWLLLASCGGMKVECEGFEPSVTTKLVEKDMKLYLKEIPGAEKVNYVLCVDSTLEDGSFGYRVEENRICLIGGDELGAAHGFYTLLEELGYTFDVTGVSKPGVKKKLSQIESKMVTPKVRWRGIRQHVNFPMDISSYKIEDAKEYLNSLLRMRFNKLVIHSYPGQWYETQIGDSLALAGNFFYGNVHYMYDNERLKKNVSRNDSIFCIPGAEPLFSNPAERSRFAVAWMQKLINYAADLGFYVQYSFEPRYATIEQTVQTTEDILRSYPRLNALEMITEETGGWGPRCTEEEVRNTLNEYFPEDIANDSTVCAPIRSQQSDLNALYKQVGIIVKTIEKLQAEKHDGPELKLGIYSSITDYTKGGYRLARLALPETPICLMPSHGSEGTAQAVMDVIHTPEDMRHTELYSWIEFDGLMYLYQNSVEGNARLMGYIEQMLPGEQHGSLLYNHWRTAENRTSARYAAESTLKGKLSSYFFYQEYAARLGIEDVERYDSVMTMVNEGDSYAKKHLGNIGFCWMGAWRAGGSYTWMRKEQIKAAHDYYLEAGKVLSDLIKPLDKSSEAFRYLSFIGNRILCSVIYLQAFEEAVEIQTIRKEEDRTVSEAEQLRAQEICNRALLLFDQYMEVHAQMMPDRGCEGTLVSLWNAPVRGLKIYRSKLGGVAPEELPRSNKPVDAPPLPIFYEKK